MKNIYKITLIITSASLASCYSPTSANPVGDTFTHAGNAIGNVVNRVVPQAPAPAPTTNQYPASTSGYPVR